VRAGVYERLYRRALIMENKWRAARYGLDGKMIDMPLLKNAQKVLDRAKAAGKV
jgi:gamma-glutamyl:cysteine ligase YbdK (ATP-grasp superfamily)